MTDPIIMQIATDSADAAQFVAAAPGCFLYDGGTSIGGIKPLFSGQYTLTPSIAT
jgi:hypothetical protein